MESHRAVLETRDQVEIMYFFLCQYIPAATLGMDITTKTHFQDLHRIIVYHVVRLDFLKLKIERQF